MIPSNPREDIRQTGKGGQDMSTIIRQKVKFAAFPEKIYRVFTDSKLYSKAIAMPASVSPRVGAPIR